MSINIFGTIGLIVITLTVTVNGNCMSGMSKVNPVKKAAEASYKEICAKCDLKVVSAEIDGAIEKGGRPMLEKVASFLECKEKDDLVNGMLAIFKECLGKLQDGASMCKKDTFSEFSKCSEEKSKEKNLMKHGMACCNNSGFKDVFKLLDCSFFATVAALKDKKMIEKSVKEWDKVKLKCEAGVSGHEALLNELVTYVTKNC